MKQYPGAAAELVSISIAPSPATVGVGDEQEMQALGVYSSGTILDITGSVTWASTNTSVATMAGNTVTLLEIGSTWITASLGGVVGHAIVIGIDLQDDERWFLVL